MKPITPQRMTCRRIERISTFISVLFLLVMPGPARADEPSEPVTVQWQAVDTNGQTIQVPAEGKTSVVLFVRADQDRSDQAMSQLTELLKDPDYAPAVQAVAVISGKDAAADSLADKWAGPVVVDPAYAASGQMSVHVWPTTVLVDAKGKQLAHMPGMSESYVKDLKAYLDFAQGKIDRATLNTRLQENATIKSTPDSVAARHLHLAERLMRMGQDALALKELKQGLDSEPGNVELTLALALVHADMDKPDECLAALNTLKTEAAPAWRVESLRGRALVELDRYDEAREALDKALKINPDPAEALYYLGRVYQHAGEWQQASEAYRKAYEYKGAGASGPGAMR